MITTLIIDDERNARKIIRGIVESVASEFEIVGEAHDVKSGLEQIRKLRPELVLLDIDMPDGNAFNLLQQIGKIDFRIIFITAHSDYAIQAFRFSAVDYILKPIISTELFRALDKAKKTFEMEEVNVKLDALLSNLKPSETKKKVVLKTTGSILCVDIDDIYFCESDGGSYTRFHFQDKSKFLVSKPLKEYDEMLSGSNFFRIHKSYLVNLDKIVSYEKQAGGSVILDNQIELTVSHRRREQFLTRYMSA
ncbi:MAG: LytTR family DNA-binding domain-containing protein [Bacteroidales bacterium]|nr:LytTR family DNA-binding domain-containing protein [Bacteroidales bacterium]